MSIIDFPTTSAPPKVEKISTALMRALRAVERGEVYRKIGRKNSKMEGPTGIGGITIWRLSWAKLIEDGDKSGVMNVRFQQVLTETGKQALETGLFDASR